jgi:methylated-DNA-[protein]-cysteine S-methyltransferase
MNNHLFISLFRSPVGLLAISTSADQLLSILFIESGSKKITAPIPTNNNPAIMQQTINQLEEYFSGKRKTFDLPFELAGTSFQKKVWNELTKIPYATTITYAQQAEQMNNRLAIRAIATANGQNKINIVIPCHRVIGSNGSLTGYGGGLAAKKWLLLHEQNNSSAKNIAGKLF